MTYKEIIAALINGKCESTASALERAMLDEAKALAESHHSRWNKRDGGKAARESAEEFYAEDITALLEAKDGRFLPTPQQILTLRRHATAWAVAEVLRTNNLVK